MLLVEHFLRYGFQRFNLVEEEKSYLKKIQAVTDTEIKPSFDLLEKVNVYLLDIT